jgi:hypothetical protein
VMCDTGEHLPFRRAIPVILSDLQDNPAVATPRPSSSLGGHGIRP